jgi:hypothetical protein
MQGCRIATRCHQYNMRGQHRCRQCNIQGGCLLPLSPM